MKLHDNTGDADYPARGPDVKIDWEPANLKEKTMHTPGPWKVGTFRFSKRGMNCSRVAVQGPEGHYIVDAVHQTSQTHSGEADANARLIAAAPQLLEALPDPNKLEMLADWFDVDDERKGGNRGGEVQRDLRAWASSSRTAIQAAKETG